MAMYKTHTHRVQSRGLVYVALLVLLIVWKTMDLRTHLISKTRFFLPEERRQVGDTKESIDFTNTPDSKYRPQNQFVTDIGQLKRTDEKALIAVITVAGPQFGLDRLIRTYRSLHLQSMSLFEWYLVAESSASADEIRKVLRTETARDSRIQIKVRGEAADGFPEAAARTFALSLASRNNVKWAIFLRSGDMLEATFFEKILWMFHSVPTWDVIGSHTVDYGAFNDTLATAVSLKNNTIDFGNFPSAAVFRVSAASTCELSPKSSHEDTLFSFWACLLRLGHWGGTIPEYLSWRFNGGSTIYNEARDILHSKAQTLMVLPPTDEALRTVRETIAAHEIPKSVALEPINETLPYKAVLLPQKSIMIIQSWLMVGGSELGFLEVVRIFAEAGYRVTVVLTRYQAGQATILQPQYLQYTHDIHFLPIFLRIKDFQPYVRHLIASRGITTVLLTNSPIAYEMLPYLKEKAPHVDFIDYLHNEGYDGWKTDGYPSFSLINQKYLSRTLTCSHHLRDWLRDRGYAEHRLGVVKLGIQVQNFHPASSEEKIALRSQRTGLSADTIVIAMIARLDTQKRPWIAPDIIHYLLESLRGEKDAPKSLALLIVGDGPLRSAVDARIKHWNLQENVKLLGTMSHPKDLLEISDIFLLPSKMEGISIACAEAMACGLPAVTSFTGGLPEQLGYDTTTNSAVGGSLIHISQNETSDAMMYAEALKHLILNPSDRLKKGAAARKHVLETFDLDSTLQDFFPQLTLAAKSGPPTDLDSLPHPAAYYTVQNIIAEDSQLTDVRLAQIRMNLEPRQGPGKTLSSACLEDGGRISTWMDSVLNPEPCSKDEIIDRAQLARSAQHQCGAYCIWDLRTERPAGWNYNGKCFYRFDSIDRAPWCKQHFAIRPPIDFLT